MTLRRTPDARPPHRRRLPRPKVRRAGRAAPHRRLEHHGARVGGGRRLRRLDGDERAHAERRRHRREPDRRLGHLGPLPRRHGVRGLAGHRLDGLAATGRRSATRATSASATSPATSASPRTPRRRTRPTTSRSPAGAQLTQELDEKNLTLVEGYGYGHDTIGRTGTPFSVFSRTLDYHSISLGASRVVNTGLVIGLFGDAVLERGDQSKPYRYIPIFAPDVAATIPAGASATPVANTRLQARPLEQLPLERDRFALTGRLAWRGESTTLRLEERGYADSWGLRASTTDARYFIDASRRFTIWPHARFHVQNGIDFWKRAYSATERPRPAGAAHRRSRARTALHRRRRRRHAHRARRRRRRSTTSCGRRRSTASTRRSPTRST